MAPRAGGIVPYIETLADSVKNNYQGWHIASLHGDIKGAQAVTGSQQGATQKDRPDSAVDMKSDEADKSQRTVPLTDGTGESKGVDVPVLPL